MCLIHSLSPLKVVNIIIILYTIIKLKKIKMKSEMNENNIIKIFSDGGAKPNPGKGGWAFAIDKTEHESGFKNHTTNNEMELTAILHAINYCKTYHPDKKILIVSDSKYCVDGFNSWMHGWAKKGWIKKGDPIKNLSLWKDLYTIRDSVTLNWVKGHSGNEMNEFVDELCSNQIVSN